MSSPKLDILQVPGARLYYKVRGTGPVLLILQGGDGDADGSDTLADQLVDHYTVVTYDRRGLSRSPLDDMAAAPGIATHGDDAHYLLAALTAEPAVVLGFSLGALIGLDLASRYPQQVRTLIAHEPPALPLLPDAERAAVMREQEEVEETRRREGPAAAMRKSMALLRMDFNQREPDIILPQPSPQRAANLEFFRQHDAPAAHHYQPNLAALAGAAVRIVPAGGRTSREIWPYRAAQVLAERLGTELVEFPGGHNGFLLCPRAFAARVREVLDGLPGAGPRG